MSASLPEGFRFVFFEGTPPPEIQELLNQSNEVISWKETAPFINFEDTPIQLEDETGFGDYILSPFPFGRFLTTSVQGYRTTPGRGKQEIREFVEDAILDLANENPSLIYYDTLEKQGLFKVGTNFDTDSWTSLLIKESAEGENDKVAGFYQGHYAKTASGEVYSTGSLIEIRPDFRGQGLCIPFTTLTYDSLLKKAQWISIYNVSRPMVVGCLCYSSAAKNIGATTFERGKPLNPATCKKRRTNKALTVTRLKEPPKSFFV